MIVAATVAALSLLSAEAIGSRSLVGAEPCKHPNGQDPHCRPSPSTTGAPGPSASPTSPVTPSTAATTAAPTTTTSTPTVPPTTAGSTTTTSTTVVPTTTATVPAGRTDLPGWKLIFNEDFARSAASGSFLSTYPNFGAYPWGWLDTSKRGHYDPNILSVSNGTLIMHLYTSSDGTHHVAAPYPKLPGGGSDQLYGRYSVRLRADPVDGYKTAWLLWPQSDLWNDGEIDFPEGDLTGPISAFLHYVGAPTQQDYFGTGAGYADWHTATTEWSPNKVAFYFDGRIIGASTNHVPAKPMHYVLQTETELGSDPIPAGATGNVQVDWISIWSYNP
jgi:Glycosyl hydrolases family 16